MIKLSRALSLLIITFCPSICASVSAAESLYQDIRPHLRSMSKGHMPSLTAFLESDEGRACTEKSRQLLARNKHRLMRRIYAADYSWEARSRYIAAVVVAGGWIDVSLVDRNDSGPYGNFLGKAASTIDLDAVAFALKYKANVAIKSFESYPLTFAKTVDIAQLLVQAGADKPIKDGGPEEQEKLLRRCSWQNVDPQVLQFYKNIGFNIAFVSSHNYTMLHSLCASAGTYSGNLDRFTQKFNIIIQSGVDPYARDNHGRSPLNMATEGVRMQPDNPARVHAQRLLQAMSFAADDFYTLRT